MRWRHLRISFLLLVPFAGADVAVTSFGNVKVVLGPDLGDLGKVRG